jgi:hypothetical protein
MCLWLSGWVGEWVVLCRWLSLWVGGRAGAGSRWVGVCVGAFAI